ncbi:MAG TPA: EAL domain-containing protein [Xanthobacteraceae bacterium]|nr:EAL domain-containing protein [Xanthobacteraceae bacterium]
MSRRLRAYVAILVGSLSAGVPVALLLRGLDNYIEREARDEARLAAQHTIARAEWRIGQSIAALETVGQGGLRGCADVGLDTVRRAVMSTTPIKQITVTDAAGNPHCLPPAGGEATALSRELRTADDRVFLTVVRVEQGERALRLTWRRAGDPLQLTAQIPADVFLPDGASNTAASNPVVRVMLNEGTLIAARDAEDGVRPRADAINVENSSTRYPLIVTATVSRAAVFAARSDLRMAGTIGAAALAVLIVALALIFPWRSRTNPIVEMERALEDGQFIPYFQPVIDLRSGAIVGAEVLMRWRKPDGSVVPPARFIPLAESSGLILDMTKALMIAARDELGSALGQRARVKLAFNLTAAHFGTERIVEEVREVFAASPVRLSQIVLEVTERQPLGDLDMARRVIAALQELGCKIAIDDVGTGHGGLSYMLKLGVNYLKVDKMFIDAIGTERYSTTIIETLIDLARNMRMEIVAEGVETFEQVKYLRDRGIFLAQGYAFAPPLPGSLFRQLLEAAHPLLPLDGPQAGTPAAVGDFIAARDRVAAA